MSYNQGTSERGHWTYGHSSMTAGAVTPTSMAVQGRVSSGREVSQGGRPRQGQGGTHNLSYRGRSREYLHTDEKGQQSNMTTPKDGNTRAPSTRARGLSPWPRPPPWSPHLERKGASYQYPRTSPGDGVSRQHSIQGSTKKKAYMPLKSNKSAHVQKGTGTGWLPQSQKGHFESSKDSGHGHGFMHLGQAVTRHFRGSRTSQTEQKGKFKKAHHPTHEFTGKELRHAVQKVWMTKPNKSKHTEPRRTSQPGKYSLSIPLHLKPGKTKKSGLLH